MTTPNNNAALGYYSGLEVDGRSGHGGGWGADGAAESRGTDQNNLPEVHNRDGGLPEVTHPYSHDYSMMQAVHPVDGSPAANYHNGGSHETGYYAPKDQYPPEVITKELHEQKNLGTICGIRKKVFWVALAVVLLIVVGAATRDVRIYYLNDDNQVAGQINANPVYGMTWDKSGVSNTFTASPKSQLLSNGIYSPDSYLSNLVIYQDSGSTLRVLRRTGGKTDWMAVGISTDFGKPAEGTGLSLIPVYTKESTKRMSLFYTTESGSLTQLTLTNDNDWSNNTLPTTLETNATITAFSSGYNTTNLVMHVRMVKCGEISTMSGDDRPIKIAANLAGRVYGLVQRSNDKVEIVEWEWIGGTTYNKIGVIDTVS
ncbi:hypothetical protein Ct61P_00173 [Colletotrichum tofieldiae]|nr:hypothetical protein Ct61P_00173 [Colletotrichum tofieldiae]